MDENVKRPDQMTAEELDVAYRAACHAMQSGVALKMSVDPAETHPKHLRVGVNSALCDQTALVRLLIEKGVITDLEYRRAIVEEMRREVGRYRVSLLPIFGDGLRLA